MILHDIGKSEGPVSVTRLKSPNVYKICPKMNTLEKWMILILFQKLPYNVVDLGKIIVATSFEWFPKVQKIAKSGHTVPSKRHLGLLK